MGYSHIFTISEHVIIRSFPVSIDAADKIYAIKFIVEKKLSCILMQLISLNINIIIYTFIILFFRKDVFLESSLFRKNSEIENKFTTNVNAIIMYMFTLEST